MNCELCNKEKLKHDNLELPIKDKLGKPIILTGENYNCECPVFYLHELCFIRDNKINFRNILTEEKLKQFFALLRERRNIINEIKIRFKTDDNNQAMAIYSKTKNLKHNKEKLSYSDSENNNAIECNNSAIWKILYSMVKI